MGVREHPSREAPGSTTGLIGRDGELESLETLIDGLRDRGGALVVRGEPGIGKSALLEVARSAAADRGVRVLTSAGAESEAQLAFAGLHQLLRPVLGELHRLPTRQRLALDAAFGLGDSAVPDTFLIALATLDLFAEMATDSPVLVLVEDAHWLDTASCDVLAFVARRVELEPIAIVFATREGFGRQGAAAGLPGMNLLGLDEGSAVALLDRTAPDLAPDLRRRVLAEAAGNPLALIELPRALRADGSDAPALQLPLPLTERLELAFAERASGLPETARAPLLVAALDQSGELRRVLDAAAIAAGRPIAVADFVDAEAAQLVTVDSTAVRFRHPLIRSAVYQAASLADRQAAHSALAIAYADDADRSVWHRAASLVAPAESVVGELEEAAARAQRRGAPAGAASALRRAAELTSDEARRGALLLQSAELEFELGHSAAAERVLREAQTLELDHRTRLRLSFLLEIVESSWTGAEKVSAFVDVAEELQADGDTPRAVGALQLVALRCWWGHPEQAVRDRVIGVAESLELGDDDPSLLAIRALADPVGRGRSVLERVSRAGVVEGADPLEMFSLGTAATAVWGYNLASPFYTAAVDGFRVQRRLARLAHALVSQAWTAVHMADARVATPAAAEGARLSEETGQTRWAASARLAQATMAAERGDATAAEELTSQVERVLVPMGAHPMLPLVQFTRGRAAIAQGRFSDAYADLRRVFDPSDAAYHPFIGAWSVADFVDSAAHGGGDLDVARGVLAGYERIAAQAGAPLLQAQTRYVRPLLAADVDAERLFQAALEDAGLTEFRCYRGRLLLGYGAWLRRQRRVAESRAPLRAAAQTFDALGFGGMSERARQELRASGETSRPRVPEAWDQLSPQELQIARMAGAGMTNREIGEKLYLSHRTIGSHLYRIFPKLGITSRGQLRDALEGSDAQWPAERRQSSD